MIRPQMQQLAPKGSVAQATAAPRSLAPLAASGTWTPLGPQPIAGLLTYGASAGRVTALAAQGLIVYAGAADGGVWKSTDGGTNWTALTDSQATLAIGAIAVDWTTTPETVYAGTGEGNHCQDCLPSQGVLKSADGGTTWTLLAQTMFTAQNFAFEGLVVDHPSGAPAARLLAATNHGLYRSIDAGATWTVTWVHNPADGSTTSEDTEVDERGYLKPGSVSRRRSRHGGGCVRFRTARTR